MEIPEVDIDTAAEHLKCGAAVFLDIRDPGSFEAAHIPGARPLSDETIAAFLTETDKSQKIIVYCYHGNSSMGGAGYLIEQGFRDVASMSGGFEGWRGRHPEEGASSAG